ncbi:hypothetical protein C2G38_2036719 [Gigaspora rosea]|uniref:Argonaute linker 1 domain-containing protein n=1 Tax=Gigaspora rosea TaxID=44941 RepID=A0A397VFM4_9GLOM|nr:hypothetical protein C2G38_2036719 [Gigaspora rosea]
MDINANLNKYGDLYSILGIFEDVDIFPCRKVGQVDSKIWKQFFVPAEHKDLLIQLRAGHKGFKSSAIIVLDVLVRHQLSMSYNTVRRSFYTSEGSQALFGGVEVWQGYSQSVRPAPNMMMINIDLSATAFFKGGPLVQLVLKLLGRRNADKLHRGITDRDRSKLEKSPQIASKMELNEQQKRKT